MESASDSALLNGDLNGTTNADRNRNGVRESHSVIGKSQTFDAGSFSLQWFSLRSLSDHRIRKEEDEKNRLYNLLRDKISPAKCGLQSSNLIKKRVSNNPE